MNENEFKKDIAVEKSTQELPFIFTSLDNSIDDSLTKIEAYKSETISNNVDQMNLIFLELIDSLIVFIELVKNLNSSCTLGDDLESEHYLKLLARADDDFLAALKNILQAKENNDFVHLNDLLEYELSVSLLNWKNSFVPTVKKLAGVL